jgi:hypothetical protein
MVGMAKSEKPASTAKKSVRPKSASATPPPRGKSAAPPSRVKLPWAQVASRGTQFKAPPTPAPRLNPPPLPKAVSSDNELSVIEVSPEWLEDGPRGRRPSKRPSKPTGQLHFVEAVRVLVGPNGEIEFLSDPAGVPSGYVEALLVATSGGLVDRLLKR